MIYLKNILYFLILTFLFNCSEKTSENEHEIYNLWLSQKEPKNITVLNGKYWESAHWSKEYEIYIQLKSDEKWWNEFKKINNLNQYQSSFTDEIEERFYKIPLKKIITQPEWFKPKKTSEIYITHSGEYFWDEAAGIIFIHEIQL